MDNRPKEDRGEEIKDLKSEDATAILTDQRAEGAGPGAGARSAIGGGSNSDAAPGGLIDTGAAGDDLPQNDMPHAGSQSRAAEIGGTGQGDDLVDRLAGGEGRGAGSAGIGSETGDMSAARSDCFEGEPDEDRAAASAIPAVSGTGDDAGAPGGMGGVRARPSGSGRPPGGVSPVQDDS